MKWQPIEEAQSFAEELQNGAKPIYCLAYGPCINRRPAWLSARPTPIAGGGVKCQAEGFGWDAVVTHFLVVDPIPTPDILE